MNELDIGLIGLAVMGRNLALNIADKGFKVGVYNRSYDLTEEFLADGPYNNLASFKELKEMVNSLKKPRKIIMMIKAGNPVDSVIKQLVELLEDGDIIMDGGNSFFKDTIRRNEYLKSIGINYFGVGISGGELGARFGPSIMPGGDKLAYKEVEPILNAISAKADGDDCCTYIGDNGAGHYVKMVHNGIEYADMQLIAESYLVLKYAGGFTNKELAVLFNEWNNTELKSYLIEITADIFAEKDDFEVGELLDYIVDSAGQKGTGRWTSIESIDQGVNVSMITAAQNARVISNLTKERLEAKEKMIQFSSNKFEDKEMLAKLVKDALYTAKIVAYSQGFSLMKDAAENYNWELNLGLIASIFRAGCIIQAAFLNDITNAYKNNSELTSLMLDEFFLKNINEKQNSLREVVKIAITSGIPVPSLSSSISYLDGFRGSPLGANLIQAQRDCFGAHTFNRKDREGIFHHNWNK